MEARLLTVAGPLEGSEFILGEGEFGIGRDRGNQAHVEDGSASRRHSVIVREGEHFRVRDLGSLNGTSVNNIPVKDRVLENGDTIRVGHSLFLFLDGTATEGGAAAAAQFDRGNLAVGQTLLLKQNQALYLNPEKAASALPGNARIARDLAILLRAAREIPSVRGATRVEEQMLDLVLEAIPAEQAAIVLRGDEGQEFTPVASRGRNEARGRSFEISRTVVERAAREGAALMSNDVLDQRFRPSESLVRQGVKALMAAPMVVFEETIGVIYVDSSDPAACFAQEDLELLAGLAALAAVALDNALHLRILEGENRQLAAELNLRHNMVGESAAMRGVLEFISKVAQTASTILLRGESGTGKELVARAIHQNSRRARKPFVAINCAALTETLLESELFGHEKGAFTGAVAQKKGKLEEAQGGTVFLDEVGELAPVLQAKLLRVLQEREFERVGGTRPIKADIRLLAATNRDLEDAVQQGTFRQDLYYRLNVVSLTAPPLRERKDDVPLLA